MLYWLMDTEPNVRPPSYSRPFRGSISVLDSEGIWQAIRLISITLSILITEVISEVITE